MKKKSKRPNGREEFERVYLRENQIRRTLENVPQEVLDEHLKDKEFTKATSYIARNTFYKNKNILLSHGFEQEDLESISKLYGLSFLSSDFGNKTGKDKYYLMMRYINQRFEAFFLFFDRKFSVSTKIPEISLEQFPTPIADYLSSNADNTPEGSYTEPQPVSLEDFLHEFEAANLKVGLLKKELLKKSLTKDEKKLFLKEKTAQLKKIKVIRDKISCLKKEARKEAQYQKKLSQELKKKFSNNWENYIEQLCYYSTSKHVPSDIRKKARSFCNKYNVDFISWAKNKAQSSLENESDFVLS